MRVVDTSAWIEWLLGSPTGLALKPELPAISEWIVPTLVQLELAKWLGRELGDQEADRVVALTQTQIVVPLDTAIAIAAAEACREHHLATSDAVIYATAIASGAELLTCDAHFEGLPGVVLIAKRPS